MSSAGTRQFMDLVLDDIRFDYGSMPMIFDTAIAAGSVVAVTGPSGAGKSTMLNLIAGFEFPLSGSIRAGGTEISKMSPAQRPVSMIFQNGNLFDHLTAEQNVLLGVSPALKPTFEQKTKAADALARTGLAGKEHRLPAQLSGGERQRVALARALIRERPILLMDEPFASLGPALRAQMVELVAELHNQTGITILFVTHHPDDIERLADTYLFVENGAIAQSGLAGSLFEKGAGEAVRAYLGRQKPDDADTR